MFGGVDWTSLDARDLLGGPHENRNPLDGISKFLSFNNVQYIA